MLLIFVVRNVTIYIRGFLYDVFGTNFLWLGARAVEDILDAQAANPVVGVFWGTAGLDRGGHFSSVAFSFLEILAFFMKQGF